MSQFPLSHGSILVFNFLDRKVVIDLRNLLISLCLLNFWVSSIVFTCCTNGDTLHLKDCAEMHNAC